ncbi:AN1-type zinc finger protein 6-like [Odocoileus virginianus]|uniref:AN1-type zinc finger protein 6-like n=1 Tax=Odocoileus virginianus TaxID=9874 RepID=A0A6J0WA94_ODOVR
MYSVRNKEHLQMAVQNSDGRISPPVPSVTSLSESLPAQSTDGSVPEAQAVLDSTSSSMKLSPVSQQSLLSVSVVSSQVDSTSLDKARLKTEDLQTSKVGLTGFERQHGNVYYGVHHYSDVHNCSYNYKTDGC